MEMEIIRFLESLQFVFETILSNQLGMFFMFIVGLLCLMFLDILTGWSQSIINKTTASHRMSEGFIKKGNIVVLLFVFVFLTSIIPKYGDVTLALILAYLYINELTSISENLLKMNINVNFMKPIFDILNKYLNNNEKGDRK